MPSAKKRGDLVAQLKQETKGNNDTIISQDDDIIVSEQPPGKRKILSMPWYIPSARLKKELRQLALDKEISVSKILTEGVALYLKQEGKRIEDYM